MSSRRLYPDLHWFSTCYNLRVESSIISKTTSQVAIVTGGSQGIGAACVRRFVKSGWRVVTISLPRETFETTSRDVLALSGDLASESTRHTLVDETLTRYGRI